MIDEEVFVGIDIVIVAALLSTCNGVCDVENCFLMAINLKTFKGGKEGMVSFCSR